MTRIAMYGTCLRSMLFCVMENVTLYRTSVESYKVTHICITGTLNSNGFNRAPFKLALIAVDIIARSVHTNRTLVQYRTYGMPFIDEIPSSKAATCPVFRLCLSLLTTWEED